MYRTQSNQRWGFTMALVLTQNRAVVKSKGNFRFIPEKKCLDRFFTQTHFSVRVQVLGEGRCFSNLHGCLSLLTLIFYKGWST